MVWFASLYISHISSLLKNKMICRTLPFPPLPIPWLLLWLKTGYFFITPFIFQSLSHHQGSLFWWRKQTWLSFCFSRSISENVEGGEYLTSILVGLFATEWTQLFHPSHHSQYVNEYESSYKTTKSSLYIYVVFSSVCIHRNYSLSLMVSRNF